MEMMPNMLTFQDTPLSTGSIPVLGRLGELTTTVAKDESTAVKPFA